MIKKVLKNEFYLYIIAGIITTIINILTFYLLNLCIDYKISNIIALIITKLTAYILNKKYVFKTKCPNYTSLLKEFISFVFIRGITLLIDYFGLIILIETIKINRLLAKIIVVAIVIIINYILSKRYVFNANKNEN